jgi:membrane protein implicated in regulation of membrane protease activity
MARVRPTSQNRTKHREYGIDTPTVSWYSPDDCGMTRFHQAHFPTAVLTMDWTLTHLWLALALVLSLVELTASGMIFLALGAAAALTALLTFLGLPFYGQLVAMGLLSGVLVPVAVRYIRPYFSPRGVRYGTTGTGVEKGSRYRTLRRDFDGATCIKVNGDFYRLRVAGSDETELPEGTPVIFEQFDGTTAIVYRDHNPKEH